MGVLTYSVIRQSARPRWAREVALPQIESLIQGDNMTAAYRLAKQAEGYIPRDPKLKDHLTLLTAYLTVTTDPPGAQFLIKEYGAPDSDYELVDSTPLERALIPVRYHQWKIVKDGSEPVD